MVIKVIQFLFTHTVRACYIILPLVIFVAFLVYFERKIIAAIQLRCGPNVVGPFGILQSFADAIKAMLKETIIPTISNKLLFLFAPLITFGLAIAAWAVIPITGTMFFANINMGVSYILATSALGVYGVIIAGWASNSKYAFLGAIRSASQMISYEVSIGFGVLCVALLSNSLNLIDIVNAQQKMWFCIPLFPIFIVFFISILAETNRHPFDLPEAEAELVAGYHTEYSSMSFTLFFLGEYVNMVTMSSFCTILFLGGWLPPLHHPIINFIPSFIWFALKVSFLLYIFIVVRASLPRYRYDQLMRLGWKVFFPLSFGYFTLVAICKVFL